MLEFGDTDNANYEVSNTEHLLINMFHRGEAKIREFGGHMSIIPQHLLTEYVVGQCPIIKTFLKIKSFL